MRREILYLQDIREACDMIQTFLEGLDASAFLASELHKAATLQKLTVIGEAATHLSQAFREAHPQVEWRDIVAFRGISNTNGILAPPVQERPLKTLLRPPGVARRQPLPARSDGGAQRGAVRLCAVWTGGLGWMTVECQGFTRGEGLGATHWGKLEGERGMGLAHATW